MCHITRSDRTYEVIDRNAPMSTVESHAYAVTFVFDSQDYGLIQATVNDGVAGVKLNPGSVWRPEPLFDEKVAGYARDLDQSLEMRARLALQLTREITKPRVMGQGQPVQVI